ncbi:hypothetical protein Bca101_082086 [Brassica carinata]
MSHVHVKKHLQVGVWKIIEDSYLHQQPGIQTTSHKYKLEITNNTSVTNSPLKLDDNFFLSLRPFETIVSGNVIGEAIDIGDLLVVQALGKFKISNAFEMSNMTINPQGSDVKEFLKLDLCSAQTMLKPQMCVQHHCQSSKKKRNYLEIYLLLLRNH